MTKNIAAHIAAKLNHPELINLLVDGISGSDLNSILLEVFHKRVEKQLPPDLLRLYGTNRLVKPANVDVIRLKEQELATLKLFSSLNFNPVELSPAAQLGSCSVVGTVHQGKILTALRNTEVQADSTNAIALHYAYLKKRNEVKDDTSRFCCVTRLLRTPLSKIEAYSPHFSIGCLVTAGSDQGNVEFEKSALVEHLAAHSRLLTEVYNLDKVSFSIIPLNGYDNNNLIDSCMSYVRQQRPDLSVEVKEKDEEQHYYKGFQVKTRIDVKGEVIDIGDGGLVDWTRQLSGNNKERMFASGIGIEYLHHLTG